MSFARRSQQVASFYHQNGTGTVGNYPAYPTMLSGWQLQAQQIDTSLDQGWTQTSGVRTTDQTINQAANTSFGQGPDNDAMVVTVTYDGTNYYSSDAQAKFCSVGPEHVIEYYAKMGPLGSGAWPACWERPLGTGEGEIDNFEWFGSVWVNNPTSIQRFRMCTIVTPYSTPLIQDPTPLPIDANGIDVTGWHHYRIRATATDVTEWIDGIQMASITRDSAASGGHITNAQWDSCFGVHPWYFRVTYQFGVGSSDNGSPPDPSLCPTKLWVRDVRIYEPS